MFRLKTDGVKYLSGVADEVTGETDKETLEFLGNLHRDIVKGDEPLFAGVGARGPVVQLEEQRPEAGFRQLENERHQRCNYRFLDHVHLFKGSALSAEYGPRVERFDEESCQSRKQIGQFITTHRCETLRHDRHQRSD